MIKSIKNIWFLLLIPVVIVAKQHTLGELFIEKKKIKLSSLSVDKNKKINCKFILINKSKKAITIKGVYPSCTCTAPEFTKIIQPKSKGYVVLSTKYESFTNKMSVYAIIKSDANNDYQKVEIVNDKY